MIQEVGPHLTPLGTCEGTQAALKAPATLPLLSTLPLSTCKRKNIRDTIAKEHAWEARFKVAADMRE